MASLSGVIPNNIFWSDLHNQLSKDGFDIVSSKYDLKEFTELVSLKFAFSSHIVDHVTNS